MPDAPINAAAVWTEATDLREVIEYAAPAWANAMIIYIGAARRSDAAAMQVAAKEMKHVVTRLEQFTRTRMRKWNTRPNTIPHQETKSR